MMKVMMTSDDDDNDDDRDVDSCGQIMILFRPKRRWKMNIELGVSDQQQDGKMEGQTNKEDGQIYRLVELRGRN